jgi:hypothetical protein
MRTTEMMLRGSLENLGPVLVALLSSELKATCWLRVTHGKGAAELAFQDDRIVWAAFDDERGLPALDAIVLGLAEADFQLEQGPPPREQNLSLTAGQLRAHLLSLGAPVMRLDAVPVLAVGDASLGPTTDLVFRRSSLEMLLAIDGQRTVRDIVGRRPLAPALLELRGLVDIGLIRLMPSAMQTGSKGSAAPVRPAVGREPPAGLVGHVDPHTATEATSSGFVPGRARPRFGGASMRRRSADFARFGATMARFSRTRAFVGLALFLALGAAALFLIPGVSGQLLDLVAGVRPAPDVIVVRLSATATPTAVPSIQPPASMAVLGLSPEVSPTSGPVLAQPSTPVSAPIDLRFTTQPQGWPITPPFATWSDGAYRLTAKASAHFVAVEAPVQPPSENVVINATFRKTGGPRGGGYGIIVRHQGGEPLEGSFQGGHYYVLEATDRGEVGVWRRDDQSWVDLLPWTHSEAVRPDGAPNELSVQTIGTTLVFLVNGIEVTRQTDAALPSGGGVGIFVGGDGNEVALERFSLSPDH